MLDPIVPYAQATTYKAKIDAAGRSAFHVHQAFERYGHCTFTTQEIFGALTLLNQMVDNAGSIDTTRKLYLPVVVASLE